MLEATGRTERELPRFRILGLAGLARIHLADQIASSGDREERELLRKSFALTFTNGVAPLADALADTEPLMLKHFNTAEVRLNNIKRQMTLVPDESAVRLDRTPGFPFGTLIGNTLLAYNGGQPYAGTGSIRAACIPTLPNINGPLGERFVTIVGGMATGKIPTEQRRAAQELKTVAAEGK